MRISTNQLSCFKHIGILLGAMFGLLTASCNAAPTAAVIPANTLAAFHTSLPSPTITATQILLTTLSPTPKSTTTAAPTAAETLQPSPTINSHKPQGNLVSLDQLAPAQYILVVVPWFKNHDLENALVVMDKQGALIGKIADGWDFSDVRVSPNQKSIVFLNQFGGKSLQQEKTIRLLDLKTGVVSLISQNCYEASWSPDGNKLALGCPGSIKILEKNNVQWLELGELPLPGSINAFPEESRMAIRPEQLIWSPDGQTIIYYMNYSSVLPDPYIEGPYVDKISCLSAAEPCGIPLLSKLPGFTPLYRPTMIWLVASNSLAITPYDDNCNINLYDLKTGQPYRQIVVSENPLECIDSIAGSQDSEMIAYELDSNVYSLDVKGDSSKLIYKNDKRHSIIVENWLTIPYPVIPNDTYTITEAGHDLNLRADPSLTGKILRKLQPGDGVTVLEGPVTANGYIWWKLKTEDSTEGWAVNIPEWYEQAQR